MTQPPLKTVEIEAVEIEAFVPAKDFELSKQFYQDQPWAMRDFLLFDPSGVLWRMTQNTPARSEA